MGQLKRLVLKVCHRPHSPELIMIIIEKPLNTLQKSSPCKKAKNVTKLQAICRKNG